MPQLNAQAIIALGSLLFGVIFGAGVRETKLRQLARDLNGIGSKVRRLQGLLIRWAGDDREKREEIARIVEGK